MPDPRPRRWLPVALAVASAALLAAAALLPGASLGQTGATPTATRPASASATARPAIATAPAATAAPAPATGSPAPAIDNETAVRTLLPAAIRDAERLPVRKWARADMPGAPGGYIVFISTIYHSFDDGNEYLLVNYLQWDGAQWVAARPDYTGVALKGDDIWLAQNLTDITALASPPEQDYRVFTVGYTADGAYSDTLARTETVVAIYDLSLTTAWSRVDLLRDLEVSHADYILKHSEDVDWVFRDIDGDGIVELIATVTDTDEITLTTAATDVSPAAGATTTTAIEIYKWKNGVFTLLPAGTPPAASTPAPSPSGTPAPRSTATPRAATPPTTRPAATPGAPASAGATATPPTGATPDPGDAAAPGPTVPAACRQPATGYPAAVPPIPGGSTQVQTTNTGLQYQDITVGTGEQPQSGQTVTINYTAYLDDGTKFDSTLGAGRFPFQFKLGLSQVIRGIDEGMATMKVGGKRRLIIPYTLGYGPAGSPPLVPPCARLIYDIELISAQ